jgi:predicted transcriptional regulator
MNEQISWVFVQSIQKKSNLSQSTISNFLSSLEEVGLLESKKINQYTYFRRNEKVINEIKEWIRLEI